MKKTLFLFFVLLMQIQYIFPQVSFWYQGVNVFERDYSLVDSITYSTPDRPCPKVYPLVSFSYKMDGLTASFTNLTTNADSYLWDFGDGTTSTEISPKHTFAEDKKYIVRLVAKNQYGSNVFEYEVMSISLLLKTCYALFKDEEDRFGYASGNTYVRHYFFMTELLGDNCSQSLITTDPTYDVTVMRLTPELKNVQALWSFAYDINRYANQIIASMEEDQSAANNQIIGEGYFLRAITLFHLVTIYAKPFVLGATGVPILTSPSLKEMKKNTTVGECYAQVEHDLIKASTLMSTTSARGDAGYANHDAALGLLSRVYLYMGEYAKVIETVNQMLNGVSPEYKLDNHFDTYFANAVTSRETLFCSKHESSESRGYSSIASMYLNDGIGWGEIFASDPLLNLYERYPSDVRYTAYIHPQKYNNDNSQKYIYFPQKVMGENYRTSQSYQVSGDEVSGYSFQADGAKHNVQTKMVNGEYKQYYVNWEGEDVDARIMDRLKKVSWGNYAPQYYVSRFSYQDNDPMLSSPVFIRWGEVLLNLAEAYVMTGKEEEALAFVNVIRKRAGIPEKGLFSTTKMHGYTNVLDVVLDERRMELAFEGHRIFDLMRTQHNIDRRYVGVQPWEVVDYRLDKIQAPFPAYFTEGYYINF